MLLDLVLKLAGFAGEDFDEPSGTAERDLGLIRANICCEYDVVVVTQCCETLASDCVQHKHATRSGAAPAAGEQKLSVAAESDVVGLSFRERQNAEQFEGIGVEEEHLLLTRNGHQRSPRATGQSGDSGHAGSVDNWFERQFLRHRRRPIRFANGIGLECEIDSRSGRSDGFAAGSLEQAAENPFLE